MIAQLIHTIAQALETRGIDYMIIGGQAVLLYGRPRLTRDIDIALGVDVDRFGQIEELCRDLNLKALTAHPSDFAVQTRVFPVEDVGSRIRVDFIFSFTPYESEAIQRAQTVQIGEHTVKVASREDVIIHKVVVSRAVDEEDVRSILTKSRTALDIPYIEEWLAEFARIPEYEHVLSTWTRLLHEDR